jgi:amylosucrase
MISGFDEFERTCLEHLRKHFAYSVEWKEFEGRLEREFPLLVEILFGLYGSRPDFAYWMEDTLALAFEAYIQRPGWLRGRDAAYFPESGWQTDHREIGAVCYVDRWAGSFGGLLGRIPYLKELGVTYLHLMPFFKSPERENDGGYAVSSYHETAPALGTMEELQDFARKLHDNGIVLVADFIFNHTSDEHEWALAAKSGDVAHRDFYFTFPDDSEPLEYGKTLRDIFPEARKGCFTFNAEMRRWVWTTFHSYQWDLNYRNPAVFSAMMEEMLLLANRGISVLRLDAVAFIWKEKGTSCENLPQAHAIIRAFQAIARLVCPSLLFKSEAIVHPDEIIRYIDLRECQISYNPLLMAELWEAAATKEVRLLARSLAHRYALPEKCVWVNYVRCHDDIGWTFADEDAAELGMNGFDHRRFLNSFYLGEFPGSFARGLSFQYNPDTNDRRICGTAASLAGIERSMARDPWKNRETALSRLLLLYGIVFSAGGIPLIYLGDELATENDPEWERNPAHAGDSRWAHRPLWSQELFIQRHDTSTVTGKVFSGMMQMIDIRKKYGIFDVTELEMLDSGHQSVLVFRKRKEAESLTVIGNFSESPVVIPPQANAGKSGGYQGIDLISGREFSEDGAIELPACGLLWIFSAIV